MSNKKIDGTPYSQQVDSDEIHLLNLWHVFYKSKKMIVAMTVLFTGILIGLTFFFPKYYLAEVIVIPSKNMTPETNSATAKLESLANFAILGGNTKQDPLNTTLSILESRFFVMKFLENHALLPVIYNDQWDFEKNTWLDAKKPSIEKIFKEFDDIYSVSIDSLTSEILISIEWTNAESAKAWATWIVEDINKLMKERDLKEATDSLVFLYNRLENTKLSEMKPVLLQMIAIETQKLVLADIRNEYALETIDPAFLPETHIWPRKSIFGLIGLLLGLFFGVFIAIWKNEDTKN